MSKIRQEQDKTNVKNKKIKKERSVDEAKTEIINEIIEQNSEIIETSDKNNDSTTGLVTPSEKYFNQY